MHRKLPTSFSAGHRRWIGCAAVALSVALTTSLPSLALADVLPVMSVAQVKQSLEAQGYSNIQLTWSRPELLFPQPQRMQPQNDETLQHQAALVGWNGTANRDGRTFDIYVTRSGQILER
jgi:hypothetical protein